MSPEDTETLLDAELSRRLTDVTRPARFPVLVPAMELPDEPEDDQDPERRQPEEPEVLIDPLSEIQAEYAAATQRMTPRPETWDDIIGNKRAVTICRQACAAAKEKNKPLPHMLFFGPPGSGKTTLSKQIAREMGSSFFETTASTLRTPTDILRLSHGMNLGRQATNIPSVVFLDEIHVLGKGTVDQESVYPWLEDWKFYHPCQGKKIQMSGPKDTFYVMDSKFDLWPFTCIGATTEPGVLTQALLRRFLIQIEMEPYEDSDLAEIILRACRRMDVPIAENAATMLSQYCRKNPGRAFSLLAVAQNLMVNVKVNEITEGVVADTIGQLNLFPLGLTQTDVRALQMLAGRMPKGIGQAELSRALGITLNQFSQLMEPYMRQLGLIQTLNRRVITLNGLRYLDRNNLLDRSRAEVRAALARTDG